MKTRVTVELAAAPRAPRTLVVEARLAEPGAEAERSLPEAFAEGYLPRDPASICARVADGIRLGLFGPPAPAAATAHTSAGKTLVRIDAGALPEGALAALVRCFTGMEDFAELRLREEAPDTRRVAVGELVATPKPSFSFETELPREGVQDGRVLVETPDADDERWQAAVDEVLFTWGALAQYGGLAPAPGDPFSFGLLPEPVEAPLEGELVSRLADLHCGPEGYRALLHGFEALVKRGFRATRVEVG